MRTKGEVALTYDASTPHSIPAAPFSFLYTLSFVKPRLLHAVEYSIITTFSHLP